MTVTVLIDAKEGVQRQEKKPTKSISEKSRTKYCLLNTIALTCIIILLAMIIFKFAFMLSNRWGWCVAVSRSFTIEGNSFMKDGKPFQYISGSIHYSRVPSVYWRDRLRKMKEAGLDAIQTYVPWNFHQPLPDSPSDWSGDRDLNQFVRTAAEEGLLVILRAGPYICAEWDFGGLPAWLLQKNASMVIRSSDPLYMKYMTAWMTELLTKMKYNLYQYGGPIIMVQLENEYGSFPTCDKNYISSLYDLGRSVLGSEVILFSTDGNSERFLKCGAIDRRFYTTVDFGTGTANDPKSAFSALRAIEPTGPLVNSEYYVGGLAMWGGGRGNVAVGPILQGLSAMYHYGANVNMYMFFGGTNFAYWNGALDPTFSPDITSYDYNAPLSEAGDKTWKYQQLRSMIYALKGQTPENVTTTNATILAYGTVRMKPICHFVSLLPPYPASAALGGPLTSMEAQGVYQGYAVYSAFANLSSGVHQLVLPTVKDRAFVFTSDVIRKSVVYHGVVIRESKTTAVTVNVSSTNGAFLHVLLENEGHINYGSQMFGDTKGLFDNVTMDGKALSRWYFYNLNVTDYPSRLQGCVADGMPAQGMFYGTDDNVDFKAGPNDTYFMPTSFKKGQLWMNKNSKGQLMNVGRYWPTKGPQKTLYVPKTFVNRGTNDIVMFEVEGVVGSCPGSCSISFLDKPDLGGSRTTTRTGRR